MIERPWKPFASYFDLSTFSSACCHCSAALRIIMLVLGCGAGSGKLNQRMVRVFDIRRHCVYALVKELRFRQNQLVIPNAIYYPVPLHLQKAFSYLNYSVGDCPNAEYLSSRTFAIPASEMLNEEEQDYIIKQINEMELVL